MIVGAIVDIFDIHSRLSVLGFVQCLYILVAFETAK